MQHPVAMLSSSTSLSESGIIPSTYALTALAQTLLLAGVALALAGCGSSVNTTLTKEWQTEVGEEARTVAVEPERGHLLVGMKKETTVDKQLSRTYALELATGRGLVARR